MGRQRQLFGHRVCSKCGAKEAEGAAFSLSSSNSCKVCVSAYNRQYYIEKKTGKDKNPPGDLLSMMEFARKHDVPYHNVKLHANQGLLLSRGHRDYLEVTKLPHGMLTRYYLTSDQQRTALEFWDRHGVKYRKSENA